MDEIEKLKLKERYAYMPEEKLIEALLCKREDYREDIYDIIFEVCKERNLDDKFIKKIKIINNRTDTIKNSQVDDQNHQQNIYHISIPKFIYIWIILVPFLVFLSLINKILFSLFFLITYFVSVYPIFIGFYIHARWREKRRLKYEFILAGLLIPLTSKIQSIAISAAKLSNYYSVIFFIPLLICTLIILIMFQIEWVANKNIEGLSKQYTRKLYKRVMKFGPYIHIFAFIFLFLEYILFMLIQNSILNLILFWILFFFFYYALLRYMILEAMSTHPIIYLRPFGNKQVKQAFKEIISPLLEKYGIILALGDASNAKSELHTSKTMFTRAFVEFAEESKWRKYLVKQIEIAEMAIIDITVPTQNIIWEIKQAKSILLKDNILILRHQNSKPLHETSDLIEFKYDNIQNNFIKKQLELYLERKFFNN